jgi:phosphatidylglycerophosphatase A
MRTKVVLFLAQGFGSGRAPLAPGTFGTLPGVVLALALLPTPLPVYIGITVLLLAVGIPLCAERRRSRSVARTRLRWSGMRSSACW